MVYDLLDGRGPGVARLATDQGVAVGGAGWDGGLPAELGRGHGLVDIAAPARVLPVAALEAGGSHMGRQLA